LFLKKDSTFFEAKSINLSDKLLKPAGKIFVSTAVIFLSETLISVEV
jgi:hypothetical protein